VAIASFAGPAGGAYEAAPGRSGIWRPDGTVQARAGTEPGAVARAALEPVGDRTPAWVSDRKSRDRLRIGRGISSAGAVSSTQHDVVDVVGSRGGPGRSGSLLVDLDVPCR
jgi:hypothetical protein